MDISTARTFIAIAETGTFQAAADRVHVTQSTVSMRIKNLEEQLGRRLFDRSKSGATLTRPGRHFLRFARAMVRAWDEGRHEVGIAEDFDELLVVGGQFSLWAGLLPHWLLALREGLERVAIRAEIGTPLALANKIGSGVMDIAVMYQPEHRPGLELEQLLDDELVLVTTDPAGKFEDRYIFMDWGRAFRDAHAAKLPGLKDTGVSADLGFLGVNYILLAQGAGYAPRRLAAPLVEDGRLRLAPDAPSFRYPIFAVTAADAGGELIGRAAKMLRDVVASTPLPRPPANSPENL